MHGLVYLMRREDLVFVAGGLQQADGHGRAAVVAQRQMGGQAALGHPLGGAARKTVDRRPRGQPHGLDLGQGEGTGQPGAGRFQKGFLGGKVGGGAGYPPGRQALGLFEGAGKLEKQLKKLRDPWEYEVVASQIFTLPLC